jgi:WD40 repeat protein
MVLSTKWQGHRAPVSCLDTFDDDRPLLLSGSEDKTARLWDLRDDTTASRRQACLCVSAPGEIFSVKFAPKNNNNNQEEPPHGLPLPTNPFAKDHTMYVGGWGVRGWMSNPTVTASILSRHSNNYCSPLFDC